MPLLCFDAGAFKAVHPHKLLAEPSHENADMTAHHEHFIMALDGVSGVLPPMKPADFSWDLRNILNYNLKKRFSINTGRDNYDMTLKNIYSRGKPKVSGGWLRDCLALSLTQITQLGNTTLAVATIIGTRITWLCVGDARYAALRCVVVV